MPLNFATDRTPEQAADGPTRSAARPQPPPPCPPLACSPSKNLVDCVPAKNNARQRSPNPDERSDRDPQISIDRARSNRRPFLPAVSSLGGFRTPTPHPARPSFKGAGVRNPRMRARKSITLLVSVNSDLSDRMHSLPTSYPVGSCDPEPRSQHPGRGVLCGGSNLQNGALMGPRVSAATANRRPHLGQEVKAGLTPLSFLLRRE